MSRFWIVIVSGALMAVASNFGAPTALAHERERCVCTMEAPPVPPVPPVRPVPPVPPAPPPNDHRVHKQVMIINPDGLRHVHRIVRVIDLNGRHIVRVTDRDDAESNMTRKEFMRRAERAFNEHDKNHDGVLEENEREGMNDRDEEDSEDIEIPEPPEAPEAEDAPEPPEAPAPPAPPRHHH